MALLTYAQQQAIKPISKNKERDYTQIQLDTERLYVSRLLGVSFAKAVIDNPDDYDDLLDGSTFECNGQILTHEGFRFVLAYYTFAEYAKVSDVADTYTGMLQQNRTETTHLSTGRINAIRDSAMMIADQAFEVVKLYLNANSSIYPLWNCANIRKAHTFKIDEIRTI